MSLGLLPLTSRVESCPSRFTRMSQGSAVLIAHRPSGCSRFNQRSQPIGAHRFPAAEPVGFSLIHLVETNPDVANRVWSRVFMTSHAVLPLANAALLKLAALKPDRPPLVEGKQKLYLTALCGIPMVVKRIALGVFALLSVRFAGRFLCLLWICDATGAFVRGNLFPVFRVPLPLMLPDPLRVREMPSTLTRQPLFSAIFGFSHWFRFIRSVVRGGIGADTSVPFRLYHAVPAGQS